MHPTFLILPLVALVPISVYFYRYIGSMAEFFGTSRKHRKTRVAACTAIVLIFALANSFFSVGFFTLCHIIVIAIIMSVIDVIYRKIFSVPKEKIYHKADSNWWNKIHGCRLVPIVLAAIIMVYGYFNMMNVIEKDFTVETSKSLSRDYTVAMIADLHMGTSMNEEKLTKYCKEISDKRPDMVVLAGDFVDENTSKADMEAACKAVGNITTKYGIYYIYGNHDATQFIWEPEYSPEEMENALTENSIKILQDETVTINGELYIIGRKDAAYMEANRKTVKELISNLDKDKFMVVLDHQPITLDETSKSGADLQLSGHTHAGQLWPIGILSEAFGFCDLNEGQKKYGNMDVIVSSGFAGYGSPIRTESNSAYEIIRIKSK